jgi:hypothetical protein
MISARLLRTLSLQRAPDAVTPSHLSAASGLARVGRRLYVMADDELSLGTFDLDDPGPGGLHRMFTGELPSPHAQRKAKKPDLEALTRLPPMETFPFGALLAIGSGSKPSRQFAVLMRMDQVGALQEDPLRVDLSPLYEPLLQRWGDINIEGAFVSKGFMCLLHRGNRHSKLNACVRFEWRKVERWLLGLAPAPAPASITDFDLGSIDGVPLGFTDGAALPGGAWVFCAAAEDTADSYADGRCAGSTIGRVNAEGNIIWQRRLAQACKTEGIALAGAHAESPDSLQLLLVTDADDRDLPAQLLGVSLPL